MTRIINYADATWPELSIVRKDIPVIMPFGINFPLNWLRCLYPSEDDLLLLPAFPYGWLGSGLEVSNRILAPYIDNLFRGLREDGFINFATIFPTRLELSPDITQHDYPSYLEITGNDINLSGNNKVVVIPIGHTEQHSYHLPMATDTLIIEAIARGLVRQVSELCFSLPAMPYGVSTHRSSFFGTLNAGGRVFEDFWVEVVDRFVERGYEKMYFINGHGGNTSFLNNVIKYAGDKHKEIFCATAGLYLSGPEGVAVLEKYRDSKIGGMGHACELETSLILHLRPDLVHMERVKDDIDFIVTPSYYMDWIEGGALIANPPWDDDTVYGAYGAGSLGTPEKGRIWLQAAIDEKVKHINEINEQRKKRKARKVSGFGRWGLNKPG